jgi:SAM-dependent methyltransferase
MGRLTDKKLSSRSQLVLISFLALYLEMVVIRWISSEIRIFAYLKNLPLIASFLGLGLGCAVARQGKGYFRWLPYFLVSLCLIAAFSAQLGITFLPFPIGDYLIVGDVAGGFDYSTLANKFWALGKFLSVVVVVFGLCVAVFLALGEKLGQLLDPFPPIQAYTLNILGSLLGVLAFSGISYAQWPPTVWFTLGFGLLLLILERRKWAAIILGLTLVAISLVPRQALWSPYYRIDLSALHEDEANPQSAIIGYNLNVNHDYHQRMLNLEEGAAENSYTRKARPYYNLPYRFVRPRKVLVVGAGSGNDVASALRHGAQRVDAVEIDPLILALGKRLHPEKPYSSDRVQIVNNDARAFFKQSRERYDLIIFGLLDSQTLLSSMSSIRLDNYIYTLESLREARNHLEPGGTICISFALVETWIQERFYQILKEVFQQEPLCLGTPYDAGISYLVGPTAIHEFVRGQTDLESMVINDRIPRTGTPLPTDDWPFLYLRNKSIPFSYWFTLSLLCLLSFLAVRRILTFRSGGLSRLLFDSDNLFMFLLGAGFMLIEVKSISDLSLLFGSTWVVNSVVIASILLMILLANLLVLKHPPRSMGWVYGGLVVSLLTSYIFKPDMLSGLSFEGKWFAGGFVSALPVFFAGILFATIFKRVQDVSAAFGANLLGALVGGILENLSMIYGIAFLNLLALAVYLVSLVIYLRPGWRRGLIATKILQKPGSAE